MPENGKLNFGRCCACECEGAQVRNIVLIELRSPEPGEGCWGCLTCGLPTAGAVAVLCDDCVVAHNEPSLVCLGPPAANRRLPLDLLTERFAHDPAKHWEEMEAAS
jgi:hypothetical protein